MESLCAAAATVVLDGEEREEEDVERVLGEGSSLHRLRPESRLLKRPAEKKDEQIEH